jgi:altronate hydrolase
MREALVKELGYDKTEIYQYQSRKMVERYRAGVSVDELLAEEEALAPEDLLNQRLLEHVDGIKFLTHDGGCGGTRQDAQSLCGLLAGYINHPNVAGATVLSLGCQNAQVSLLQEELRKRNPNFDKPLFIFEQQGSESEYQMISKAIRQTFAGLIQANELRRAPAPLSKLVIGMECGGSDGFSGISANPAMGYAADLLVALGGTAILSEFPELCGVEQELIDRSVDDATADHFIQIQSAYSARATAVGSGFDMNPSPGNIKDGLITDAIKSAGAARKGGTSPITDVLDYPEYIRTPGLNLLCTPGNDVESTTGLAGAGANLILFSTGLGTPTGNPVTPVVKVASNSRLAQRMADIIDIDTGTVISGEDTIESMGEKILEYCIWVASGEVTPKAVQLGQDDFIPWKRGVSL